MLTKLKQSVFRNNKKKVSGIMNDIELFYTYIEQNGQVVDDWFFRHVLTAKYWNYLYYYRWLSSIEQDFLHRGILSMLLFMGYNYLEGKGDYASGCLGEIKHALQSYHSDNEQNNKLHHLVKNTIILMEKKQNGLFDSETDKSIFKSVSWTLKNIVLANNRAM